MFNILNHYRCSSKQFFASLVALINVTLVFFMVGGFSQNMNFRESFYFVTMQRFGGSFYHVLYFAMTEVAGGACNVVRSHKDPVLGSVNTILPNFRLNCFYALSKTNSFQRL